MKPLETSTTRRVRDAFAITRKPRGIVARDGDLVPFVPMASIPQDGTFTPQYTTKSISAITSGTYFEPGDVLVAKITPCFENGKQAIARNVSTPYGYATTEVIPLHPLDHTYDPRFLFYYLLHPSVRARIASRMEGATARLRVPEEALLDLPYPNFSSTEQRNIADSLEAVRHAIYLEAQCQKQLTDLKRAAMHELFTRGLRGEPQKETEIGPIPESWDVERLGGLGRVGNGSTPRKRIPEYWDEGSYPWLTSAKVYDRQIVSADQFVTGQALTKCHLPRLQPGTILIAITGEGKTLGHCAVLGIEATISQHLAYIAVDPSRAESSFVRSYLETQYEVLRQVAAGGGSTKGALTCAFLREVKFPMPSIDEQREIVEIVDSIDRKLELHKRKKAALEELFKTLLNGLMTGEIAVTSLNLGVIEELEQQKAEPEPQEVVV